MVCVCAGNRSNIGVGTVRLHLWIQLFVSDIQLLVEDTFAPPLHQLTTLQPISLFG